MRRGVGSGASAMRAEDGLVVPRRVKVLFVLVCHVCRVLHKTNQGGSLVYRTRDAQADSGSASGSEKVEVGAERLAEGRARPQLHRLAGPLIYLNIDN